MQAVVKSKRSAERYPLQALLTLKCNQHKNKAVRMKPDNLAVGRLVEQQLGKDNSPKSEFPDTYSVNRRKRYAEPISDKNRVYRLAARNRRAINICNRRLKKMSFYIKRVDLIKSLNEDQLSDLLSMNDELSYCTEQYCPYAGPHTCPSIGLNDACKKAALNWLNEKFKIF